MFKIGPAGKTYGGKDWDEKGRNGIAQIFISHGESIDSLQFQFVENGTLVLSEQHGNLRGAPKFSAVKLNYPSEFITGISGYSGNRDYGQCVTSIIFTTNIATYGPFGCPTGDDIAFDYQIGGHNKFCGFYGSASSYLDSIGVYMEPMTTLSNVTSNSHSMHIPAQTKELVESLKLDVDKIKQQSEKSSVQLQKEFTMIKIGPVGGAGTAWDDGGRFQISQIFVSHGNVIDSLQYQYIENGASVLSEKHGSNDGHTSAKFTVVTLDYPSEFLTAITGSYGWFSLVDGGQMQIVSSIRFNTNTKTYGPFGCHRPNDAAFDFQLGPDNEFGGFHGIAGMYLNSIGVYVKPRTSIPDVGKAEVPPEV